MYISISIRKQEVKRTHITCNSHKHTGTRITGNGESGVWFGQNGLLWPPSDAESAWKDPNDKSVF